MEVYQFVAPALAFYYIYRISIELKARKKFIFTSFLWLTFWFIIAVLGIVPHEFSTKLAKVLGFASNINAIIFIALGFLILLAFYLSSKLDTMERKMTDLVRQLSLDEGKIRDLERKRWEALQSTDKKKVLRQSRTTHN